MSSHSNLVVLLDPGHPEAAPQEYTDADAAFEYVKKASRLKSNMAHFTELWDKMKPKRLKGKVQKDRDVLKGVAGLIADGKLMLKARREESGGDEDDKKPGAASSAPAPRKKRPVSSGGMKIRERPDPPPPAPPPPEVSVAQQVDALLAAADSGAPFCEQCNKTD